MANNENLKPLNERCKEDAKKIRSKGGKARAAKIKEKKTMKEMLDYLLEKEIANKSGEKASTQEAISIALIKQALNGNVKAYEVIRDTIGEKPTEKQEITNTTPQIVVATKTDADYMNKIANVKINKDVL
jgi:hypothetical protein